MVGLIHASVYRTEKARSLRRQESGDSARFRISIERPRARRGEARSIALMNYFASTIDPRCLDVGDAALTAVLAPAWHAIWTRSHSEQLVTDQLTAQGFEIFMPRLLAWGTRRGERRRVEQPLFPGYVFVHHAVDRHSYAAILKARGVVRVLGERWDRLAVIPASEIDTVQRMLASGAPVSSHQFAEGDRVRVTGGPLSGLVGVFKKSRKSKGLLMATITLVQRSVAVEVDASLVEPT